MLETKYGMKYSFPHTLVHIVDNSAYTGDLPLVVADDPSMYGTLVVAGFPMGEDRSVINIGRSDILNVAYGLGSIGASDVKKYGQSITYPLSLIDQGAPVQLLRVTPEDATYAYSCVTIEWRWDIATNTMHVRYGTAKLDNDRDLQNFQNRDRLAAYITKKVKSDDVSDNDDAGYVWKRRAFIVNVSAGRGSEYNKFATAISQTQQAKRPANAMYLFSTIDTRENMTVEQFHASLVNIDNKRTDSIEPVNIVVKKRAPGSSVVVPFVNEDAIAELYAEYRQHLTEMIDDNTVIKSEYEINVAKVLTVNTFDPIFGLYIYGGTDENAKLPWFQVDMRSADKPMLPEGQRIFVQDTTTDTVAISNELVDEKIYGVKIPGNDIYVGDIYLWSAALSKNNPYIYVVAAINQYTGAVTTVRTNKLKYEDASSTLVTIIETNAASADAGAKSFVASVAAKLKGGSINDTNTVAWYDGTAWYLYYLPVGSKSKAINGQFTVTSLADLNSGNLLNKYALDKYTFIDWGTNNDLASNLIGINETDAAYNRIGATRINKTGDIGATGTVTVNGYTIAENETDYYDVDVANRDIFKYGLPESTIDRTESDRDMVGMQFDVFKCDPEQVYNYYFDNEVGTAITPAQDIVISNNMQIGVTFDSDSATKPQLRFVLTTDTTDNTQATTVTEVTGNDISKTTYQTIASGMKLFPALNLFKGYYKSADNTFHTDAELESDPVVGNTNWIYKDEAEGGKYYWFTGDSETPYVEITGLDAEDQIVGWFQPDATGNWTAVAADITTTAKLAGYSFELSSTNVKPRNDERNATEINRYQIIGTLGSLYRIQASGDIIPADYYASSYGINVTPSGGGVELEDGSTGFLDDPTIDSIEFKWRYSMLLVEAFRGQIDPKIMSPTRCPFKYLFDGGWNTIIGQSNLPQMQYTASDIIMASTIFTDDEKDEALFNPDVTTTFGSVANKSIDVKQAMYDLMEYRVYQGIPEDKRPLGPGSGMSLHLDSGVTDVTTALTINDSFKKRFSNPNASWDIGGYVSAVDGLSYTFVKRIADNLVRHCLQYSVNKPYVMTYSTINSDEYVSYFPEIDTTDWEYRQLMYDSGGNSWIPDNNGNLMRRSQRTLLRTSDTSDLIQESNMRTLTQLVYLLQNKLEMKLFEYNDDSVLRTMQDEVNNMFTNWVGVLVDGLNIRFERDINPIDGGELVVCYVDVVFRGINLRIPIIVNVNRRTETTT